MKSCANCKMCYQKVDGDSFECLRGNRGTLKDLFTLGRVSCDDHEEVAIKFK